MCVQNDMLTIAGEARRQNGTHPNGSRKRSPVRRCGVPDSSRRAAACADSQNFTCARHVRNWLPYRLTFRFVVISRLRSREFDTGSRLHLTGSRRPPPSGPVCMYRRGAPGDRFGFDTCKSAVETGTRSLISACLASPGAHCTARKSYPVPKILTSSTAC